MPRWQPLLARSVQGLLYLLMAVLHAAAALFHHYALRDNTLRLMLLRR